jgi:DNA-binding CsgD family transcriptional regulator
MPGRLRRLPYRHGNVDGDSALRTDIISLVATAAGKLRLVGRGREVRELEAELRRTARGGFYTVLISAEAGIGKTRLAGELLDRNRHSVLGLSARAYRLGGTSSLGMWVEALEPPLRSARPDELAELCGGFLDDLAALFRTVAAARGGPPAAEPPRMRLLEGLAVLLENLSRRTQVVLFLDDLQLADASSLEALQYMSRRLSGARVLVLAAARPAELADNHLASEILLGLEQDGLLSRLNLAPLGGDGLRQLAEQVLNARSTSDTLIEWLEERSRGHPLFALGLLRALVDEGADLEAPRLRRVPENLSARVTARLELLDEGDLAVLELLAVHGQRAGLQEIAGFSDQSPERLALTLDSLIHARLVVEEERGREVTYEVVHPLIQEAIYERIGAARRRMLHRRVARALLESGRFAAAGSHFVQSAAPGDSEAIDALIIALHQAQARELHREAIAILKALMEVLAPGDRRWLQLLEVLVWQGTEFLDHKTDIDRTTIPTALRQIEEVLAGSEDLASLAALKYCLSNYLTYDEGRLDEARRACEESLELFERAGDRAGVLVAAHELAWIVGFAGDLQGQEQAARKLVLDALSAQDQHMVMLAQTVLGYACFLQGSFGDAEAAISDSLEIATRQGRVQRVASNLSMLAQTLALEGRIGEADALLAEARRGDAAYGFTILLDMSARIRWLAGDFAGAIDEALEATSWTRGGVGKRRGWAVAIAAMAAAEMGRADEARTYLKKAEAAYAGREWYAASHHCTWAEGVLAFYSGDGPTAVSRLLHAATRLSAMASWPLAALVLIDLAEIAALEGDGETAAEADGRLRDIAARLNRDLYEALGHLGSACAQLAAGRQADAVGPAETAVTLLEGSGCRAFHARALELLGRALSVSDRAAASSVLATARTRYAELGAAERLQRVDGFLARLGHSGRRTRISGLGVDSLSRREREVARLALEGRTAREIAGHLFIGERTVETHLANAYAKLGVRSKLELVKRASELNL